MTETVSLNGQWGLAFDPQNTGTQQEWFRGFKATHAMAVPGVWEQVRPGYDGVGWYQTTVEALDTWSGKTVRLRFGAVQYVCDVWLNGELLGSHEGGCSAFEFDVSRRLRSGSNTLIVRVINPPMDHAIEGFRAGAPLNQGEIPVGKAGWYYNFGGIWQDVELLITEPVYISDVYVQPFPAKNKAVCCVTVRSRSATGPASVTVAVAPASGGKPVASVTHKVSLRRGDNAIALPVPMPDARLWSPDDPYLYRASTVVSCGDSVMHEHDVRFGMREFSIRGGSFMLNGRPIRLRGFLQQGMYPRTLIFPETPELAWRELKLLKDNGFNFLRAHLKPPNPYYLDMADELGILVEAEPCIGWISNSPETERRCWGEIEGMIRRDRNHASVVFWCLMNEAYHFRGFSMRQIKSLTTRLAAKARKLDPTRLLMDTSGGGGSGNVGGTDIMLPNTTRTAEMVDAHAYCPLPVEDAALEDYRTMGRRGQLLFVSEYGAPETPPNYAEVCDTYTPQERKLGLEDYVLHKDFYTSMKQQFRKAGLRSTFGSADALIEEVNRVRAHETGLITAAMRANPNCGGWTFCQLADASGELFGATDVWRSPKPVFHEIAAAAATPVLVPSITPRVQAESSVVSIGATLVNEDKLGECYDYELRVMAGTRCRKRWTGTAKALQVTQELLRTRERLGLPPGTYSLDAVLKRGRRVVARQSVPFTIAAAAAARADHVGAMDPSGSLAAALKQLGVATAPFSNNYRDKDAPVLLDLRQGVHNRQLVTEIFGQLRKIVELGGCAVLFEPEVMPLYEHLFPSLIRMQGVMRTIAYVKKHRVFDGMPSGCVAGYEYADLMPDKLDKGDDVKAAGGNTLMGALSMHMWTRPACYFWGAGLYTLPIGRGQVVVCHLKVLDHLRRNPLADKLMANLVDYAASVIKPGGDERLLSRCIDPLPM